MHILIKDVRGKYFSVRKGDIKRTEEAKIPANLDPKQPMGTKINFAGRKENPAIYVAEDVKTFHIANLQKRIV